MNSQNFYDSYYENCGCNDNRRFDHCCSNCPPGPAGGTQAVSAHLTITQIA